MEVGLKVAQDDVIEIDHDLCFMSGECVLAAPEVYEFNEEGYPVLIDGGVETASTELLERTADMCPSGAIKHKKRR